MNLERTNVADLTPAVVPEPVSRVVVDVSRLSLGEAVRPATERLALAPPTDLVGLPSAPFLANVRYYSLGLNATAGQQTNGVAGNDGADPTAADYDTYSIAIPQHENLPGGGDTASFVAITPAVEDGLRTLRRSRTTPKFSPGIWSVSSVCMLSAPTSHALPMMS